MLHSEDFCLYFLMCVIDGAVKSILAWLRDYFFSIFNCNNIAVVDYVINKRIAIENMSFDVYFACMEVIEKGEDWCIYI